MPNIKMDKKNQELPDIIVQKIIKIDGQISLKSYKRGQLLGKGGFAKCYQAINIDTQKKYAVKIVSKTSLNKNKTKNKLLSQIKIHRSVHHKNIVNFQNFFDDQNFVYIFLELCPYKSLSDLIKKRKRLSQQQAKFFFFNIIQGIYHLHKYKIIHREYHSFISLKPGNIFLGTGLVPKIGDFGLACKLEFDDQKKRTVCGTPNYIAPEIIQNTEGHSYSADIWSSGVILFILLFGKAPFQAFNNLKQTYAKIRKCNYEFPIDISVSNEAKNFIKKIFVNKQDERMTMQELFQHQFCNDISNYPQEIDEQMYSSLISFFKQYKFKKTNKNMLKLDLKRVMSEKDFKPLESGGLVSAKSPRNLINDIFKIQEIPSDILDQVCIYKYLDMQSKYGLGFILTNGNTGIFFNDNTILIQQDDTFLYIVRSEKEQKQITFSKKEFEQKKEYQKKKKLFYHFKIHLQKQQSRPKKVINRIGTNNVYPKQWIRTKQALLIRLSNRTIHVFFDQGDQVIIQNNRNRVRYWKQDSYEECQLADVKDFSDLQVRITYTKRLLKHIIN